MMRADPQDRFDIVGTGCCAVDTVLSVERFPAADEKVRVLASTRRAGGLCATALAAAARLGARCGYLGTLGHDDQSLWTLDQLRAAGVETTHTRLDAAARPNRSTVIVERLSGRRIILSEPYTGRFTPADRAIITSARVLLVDHTHAVDQLPAARWAREAGVAVVADIEKDDEPAQRQLSDLADHLIVSERHALAVTGETSPPSALQRLWNPARSAVVITAGERGAFWCARPDQAHHTPALPVAVVDTNGCGDVFHGAYAAALARGVEIRSCVEYAARVAGMKAARAGGWESLPTHAEVSPG